jgi:hypothetical protein
MIIYCPTCDKDISGLKVGAKRNHLRWCKTCSYTRYDDINWEEVQNYYDTGKSYAECATKFNCTALTICKASKNGLIKKRNRKENAALIYVKYGKRSQSEETKIKLRNIALNSPHRRLKKKTIKYKGVLLDSSWELNLANILDNLKVLWIRPKPIRWKDSEGIEHNYFSDFFLPDYNLFLDPKNPFARQVQSTKIQHLKEQYNNIIFLTKEQLTEEYIKSLLVK